MENNQRIAGVTQIDDSFTEKWFSQEISLVTGLYQLVKDGQWRCVTVSEDCLQVLNCIGEDFLERLQNLPVRTAYHAPEKTVGDLLDEIVVTQKRAAFICIRPWANESIQYIKGTLAPFRNQEGLLCVQGQITDVSAEQTRDTHSDMTEEYDRDHQQSLDRSGLLQIAQMVFPEILSMNLTKGTYRMLQYYGATTLGTPTEGPLDQMLLPRLENVAPEDQAAFQRQFFRERQLKAIQEGKERIQLTYRRRGADGVWHWMESIVVRQENPYNDDILTFAVSHNVDEQKAQEERLQQALAESVDKFDGWHYYNRLSNQTYAGLTYVHYLDDRPSPYVVGTLARRLDCPEKELALGTCFRIPKEDQGLMRRAYEEACRTGETSFHADYRIETDRGETVWVYNHAVRFEDKEGAAGYIHFLADTTREHTLMEQLRLHMEEQVKKEQQVFQMVAQHSNRILYAYDLATGTTHPWDEENEKKDLLAHLYTGTYSEGALEENAAVLPESVEDVKRFFADIHGGVPAGELKLHIRMADGQLRWYHFQYSSFFDGGQPTTALISIEDITERHEQEIAYRRHVRSVIDNTEKYLVYLESCLTCDRVETLSGQMLSDEEKEIRCSHSDFGRLILRQNSSLKTPKDRAGIIPARTC